MRITQALGLAGPQAARKTTAAIVIGGAAMALFVAMLGLGVSMPVVFVGSVLAAIAAATVIYPEVGLAALVINALVGLTHLRELPTLGPVSIPIAFELILAAAVAVQVALGRRRLLLNTPQHVLLLILTFWIVVSLLISGNVGEENVDEIRNVYLARALLFFLLTSIISGERALKRLVAVFAVANFGLVVASVSARLGYLGQEKIYVGEKMLRTQGLVHNPNTLAFDLTTMLILAVFSLLYVKRRWAKGLLLLLALADAAVILSTLSRSGFISLVAVLLFMFFKLTRSARVIIVVLIVALTLGLLSQSNLMKRFQRVDEIRDVDRFRLAKVGLNAAAQNPFFGVGIGNFLREFDKYNDVGVKRKLPTHNMYMYLSAQMGIPALLMYLSIVAITWVGLARMEAALKDRGGGGGSFLFLFNLAVQSFFVNLCVFGLSGDVAFEYSVFIMIGMGILLHRAHQETRPAEPAR